PAAITQLKRLAEQTGADAFDSEGMTSPVEIVRRAADRARLEHFDYCIVDSAGRLHIDDALMDELKEMKDAAQPDEVLLVADAMTGQEAVNLGEAFSDRIGITGVVLTKLDGDARGGGALSLRSVTGVPVKMVGAGEKHPERMASRVLGMGDVMSLIEKAEAAISPDDAQSMVESLGKGTFTLVTMKEQILQMRKMGSMGDVLSMIPGLGNRMPDMEIDETELTRTVAIIDSMTPAERTKPEIIKGSRRKRIAAGSGTRVQDVNRLLKQFAQTQKLMKQFSKGGKKKQMQRMRQMLNF
ncbi:MAG: signal recognition particle protein, partial [Nitrospinae bacterium]|nr:signal recognition particle protein [Nitrospinota bacterium]